RLSALPPGAWPCNTLNNHDASRVYSRYGDGQNDAALARLHLALLLTLRGTPFLYNGEEIGMTDFMLEDISQFRDTPLARMYPILMEELGMSPAEALAMVNRMGRDKCRTPVQWDDAPNGGFSPAGVQTWLPVNPNYSQGINVTDQLADPDSLLNFYRRLLRVRKQTPALIAGDYRPLHEEAEDYLAFLRSCSEQTCLVVLNMSDQAHTLNFDGSTGLAEVLDAHTTHPIFSSHTRGDRDDLSQLAIAPFEIYIAEIV
ncbi:MAG: alpha-glucosidase C-terminal domain-containing protein, partial [Anaerolineae bacterium]|nr:alpha-glucosidase C-terminal domain-containing protein [Anaerolineae bacterium]